MRRALRQIIPSMFHRRLLLLVGIMVGVVVVLLTQTARLTLGAQHDTRRAMAEAALVATELVPTVRGRVLDRKGRVLAEDQPGLEIAVSFPVITGRWAYEQAERKARREQRLRWAEMTARQREILIAELQRPYDDQVRLFWQTLADVTGQPYNDILTRRQRVQTRIAALQSHLWGLRQQQRSEELGRDVAWAEVVEPIAEQRASHAIVERASPAVVQRVRGFIAESQQEDPGPMAVWDQVTIRPVTRRSYPWETKTVLLDTASLPGPLREQHGGGLIEVDVTGVGVHLLGHLRSVYAEDERRRPFYRPGTSADLGGYRTGDQTGLFGVERTMESHLRGSRGRVVRRLDREQIIENTQPKPGRDVRLALDIALQARVQAVMSPQTGLMQVQPWHNREEELGEIGTALNGAAVVVEVETGNVLAAVSIPTAPLELFIEEPRAVWDDKIDLPYLNRTIARSYQPGSTVKPLIVAAAISDGKLGPEETIDCSLGYLWPGSPTVFRDWRYKDYGTPFGALTAADALKVSSNVFMGTLTQRIGANRTAWWYRQLGMDQPTGTGLGEEISGNLPSEPVHPRAAAFTSIGQGPIDVTPMQLAQSYATLVRGGRKLPATVVLDPAQEAASPRFAPAPFTPAAVSTALEGMRRSANERDGTTHHLSRLERAEIWNVPDLAVLAKSGTAQAAPLRIDSDGDGRPSSDDPIAKSGNHAWVVALATKPGRSRPSYVVVVIVEYAGSGGQVAGPIANQILHALRAEGYL